MIVLQVDRERPGVIPPERHPPVACRPHSECALAMSFELVEIETWNVQLGRMSGGIERRQNSPDGRVPARVHPACVALCKELKSFALDAPHVEHGVMWHMTRDASTSDCRWRRRHRSLPRAVGRNSYERTNL